MASRQIVLILLSAAVVLAVSAADPDCVTDGTKCVKTCDGHPDGSYQSCHSCRDFVKCSNNVLYTFHCPAALKWDDSLKRCVQNSSTCKGCLVEDASDVFEDAPMSEEVPMSEDTVESIRISHIPRRKRCKSTGPNCVSDCTGQKDGDYQSCHGCDVYVSCVGGLRYDDRPCAPGGLVWDDKLKRCEYNSSTCHGCQHPSPCNGTGPCCITSCKGLPCGNYQSCKGCHIYVTCDGKGGVHDKQPCAPKGTVWDDNKKACAWYSNTCFRCPHPPK